MAQTLLHISDSWINGQQYEENETAPLGGLKAAIDRATHEGADAVIHSGNLFERANPEHRLINAVKTELDRLNSSNIEFMAIRGPQEARGSVTEFSNLVDDGYIEHLTSSPTTLGNVAIFGIDNVDSRSELEMELASLSPADSYTGNIVVVNQEIWPPGREETADISSLDFLEATDVYLNVVLAGGIDYPRQWESDTFDYRVIYSGASNPAVTYDESQVKTSLVELGTDNYEYDQNPLLPSHS